MAAVLCTKQQVILSVLRNSPSEFVCFWGKSAVKGRLSLGHASRSVRPARARVYKFALMNSANRRFAFLCKPRYTVLR